MKITREIFYVLLLLLIVGLPHIARANNFYWGVDLSSVNAREACGAKFRNNGILQDPYKIFAEHGANLVRVRLWNDPSAWTDFGNLPDVEKTIARAKAHGMKVLLDLQYSDHWADVSSQVMPEAWRDVNSNKELATRLYQYTAQTLQSLDRARLMPDFVQIGNETNRGFLMRSRNMGNVPMDWGRDALLFQSAIQAVRDVSEHSSIKPKIVLHFAEPDHLEVWLDGITRSGVTGFDIIGLSYYPKWTKLDLAKMGNVIKHVTQKFGIDVMIVETAYPASLDYQGFPYSRHPKPGELNGREFLVPGFPATPQGQNAYMTALTQTVKSNGGIGVVYWEPARVDVICPPSVRSDGDKGWQNATFFDKDDNLFPSFNYMQQRFNGLAK